MCSSRNNPYPPHRRSSEIPKLRGVLKAKILEAMCKAKLKFLGEGECSRKQMYSFDDFILRRKTFKSIEYSITINASGR